MSIQKVVIIIPTYNEALMIQETIIEVFKAVEGIHDYAISLLIFDSASTDETQNIVKNLQDNYADLILYSEPQKSGLGSAYHQAMQIALNELSADVIFEFDADLSHQPCYIKPMLLALETADAAVGSRYIKGGSIPSDWGWHRKLFSKMGNCIARFVLTPKYKDFTSGFRATRRHALQKALPAQFLSNQYAYKLELFWRLHQIKAKIQEYPIQFIDRTKGDSKLPTNSIPDALRVIFTLRYRELKRYLKMCMVGFSGALIQFLTYNILCKVISPLNAAQIAVSLAIVNNFCLNHLYTFKEKEVMSYSQKIKGFFIFGLYSFLMVQFQSHSLEWGIQFIGRSFFKENAILILTSGLGSLFNYLIYSRVIWRSRTS